MDVNDALRTAITEFNQGGQSLDDFRVFFVKKGMTFDAQTHAGYKVFNLYTETNQNRGISAIVSGILQHQSTNNLQVKFQSVKIADAKNIISGELPNSLTMYKLVLLE